MSIFYATCLTLVLFISHSSAMAFEMDRGIGFSKGRDIEDWVDAQPMKESPDRYQAYMEKTGLGGGANLATAYGNSIVIQTQPGSHVMLNASQINTGNQVSEVNLIGDKQTFNVEVPPEETQDAMPMWVRTSTE